MNLPRLATTVAAAAAVALPTGPLRAQPTAPAGEIQGSAWTHTPATLAASVQQAAVCLPAAAVAGGQVYCGRLRDLPATAAGKVPVVLFLHGSSGLSLKAIADWQRWLADLGWASLAPDSFALPQRVTYKSPIDVDSYEKIHALRSSEIAPALEWISRQPWVDTGRLVLAGTSEGAVPVARWAGTEFAARMMYAWSCEANYFVRQPANALPMDRPVLNVISTVDPFFSKANGWLGNPDAAGHCGAALKDNPRAAVVLVPGAPHTLLNLPAARVATAGFLAGVGRP